MHRPWIVPRPAPVSPALGFLFPVVAIAPVNLGRPLGRGVLRQFHHRRLPPQHFRYPERGSRPRERVEYDPASIQRRTSSSGNGQGIAYLNCVKYPEALI